jgi:hypothetical protein
LQNQPHTFVGISRRQRTNVIVKPAAKNKPQLIRTKACGWFFNGISFLLRLIPTEYFGFFGFLMSLSFTVLIDLAFFTSSRL